MTNRQRFAKCLREYRARAKISQEALAESAGLHRTYISQLERGLKSPTLDVIIDLAIAMRVTPHDFVSSILSEIGKK